MAETEPKPTGRTMAVVVRKYMAAGQSFENAVALAEMRVFGQHLTAEAHLILVQALKRAGVGV